MARSRVRSCVVVIAGIICGMMFVAALPACKGSGSTAAAPTPEPTIQVGVVNNTGGFYVTPILANGVSSYFHEQSTFSSGTCVVAQNEPTLAKKDIYCILDIAELDLYFNSLTLDFNTPPNMCAYTEVVPYGYWVYPPAPPNYNLAIAVTQDAAGVTTGVNPAGALDTSGQPICPYDYSPAKGPNCCEGKSTITTTQGGGPPTFATVTFSGLRSNCISGPIRELGRDKNGYPMPTINSTLNSGQNIGLTAKSPMSLLMVTNTYLANYFNPTDFGAGAATFPAAPANIPTSMYAPYYEFKCLDPAFEFVARIRVLIRSWDTVAGFNAQTNPYTAGAEPQFATPNHDLNVWKDLLNGYIGSGE